MEAGVEAEAIEGQFTCFLIMTFSACFLIDPRNTKHMDITTYN